MGLSCFSIFLINLKYLKYLVNELFSIVRLINFISAPLKSKVSLSLPTPIILTCLKHLGDVALVVVGDGPMKESYINTARKEDVSDKLFFVDSVPYTDLASFSKSADIGVTIIQPISKSYENALPNKLFEYAVSGLPVICSNLVAMKEMVSIYKCGISIPPTDLNAFIEAFNTINKNENNFKIGINLQKELLWENQNKQLIELIK